MLWRAVEWPRHYHLSRATGGVCCGSSLRMIARCLLFRALVALPFQSAGAAGGMVAAADPRAAEAGREIVKEGGSAADAAIAMLLALTIVEPQSSAIGGGGFMVHHDAGTHKIGRASCRARVCQYG